MRVYFWCTKNTMLNRRPDLRWPMVGSLISAAHLPQGLCRTPRYVLFLPFETTTAGATPLGTIGSGVAASAAAAPAAAAPAAPSAGAGLQLGIAACCPSCWSTQVAVSRSLRLYWCMFINSGELGLVLDLEVFRHRTSQIYLILH